MAVLKNALAKKGNFNPRAEAALVNVKAQVVDGASSATGLCLQRVRECFGIPAEYPTAIAAWKANLSSRLDYTHTWYDAPAGCPVFWSGGSSGAGHIAISDGKGNVYSTDIRRAGKFDLVPIAEIHEKWGLTYLGWTELLNGDRVYN